MLLEEKSVSPRNLETPWLNVAKKKLRKAHEGLP
jgi:hypothetical protein